MPTLLSPEEIATQAGSEASPNRLPSPRVFAGRAERLRSLAPSHAMADFLAFAARLADAQQTLLDRRGPTAPPDEAHLRRCRQHGMPPLDAHGAQLPADWMAVLHELATAVVPHAPAGLQNAIAALPDFPQERLAALARAILRGDEDLSNPIELALAPLIGASLQVLWASRALGLATSDIPAGFEGGQCPACGAPPVACIVRIGDAGHGVRYATCSLCACEWHVTRIKCVPCQNTRGIAYQALEGASGPAHRAVRAETCPDCQASLKIVSMETDPAVDAFADDLATLSLDMLVDEAGFHRAGRNLFLFLP
ncbi:MAG: formate dehydrogenase accessory protein FdhE [Zoogloea sp.]|uniref:formate dehydrogenase accessory protein FdhE n=1 Tax=Zoogloea sp. TaxID=49181 RepID=UPI002616E088|nr:formate dehydrogenase accessory protein FdhE [Zoogloea sp.]MDD3326233.1 formate dehydrogenase accessory protein FdhE [Zoogloea sp.]